MEVVASLSQGRTTAGQCGLFTYKSVPVIFEPPCSFGYCKAGEIKISHIIIRMLIHVHYIYFHSPTFSAVT